MTVCLITVRRWLSTVDRGGRHGRLVGGERPWWWWVKVFCFTEPAAFVEESELTVW